MTIVWANLVQEELRRHGLEPTQGDTPAGIRERLNELYVARIRELKARLTAEEFPVSEYAERVQRLKEDHPLLGVPLDRWTI